MTQPVQEPTEGRAVAGLKWQTSQLFRRPLPASSSGSSVEQWPMSRDLVNFMSYPPNLDDGGAAGKHLDQVALDSTYWSGYYIYNLFDADQSEVYFYTRLGPKGSLWTVTWAAEVGPDCGSLGWYMRTGSDNSPGNGYDDDGIGMMAGHLDGTFGAWLTLTDAFTGTTAPHDLYNAVQNKNAYGFYTYRIRIMGDDGAASSSISYNATDDAYHVDGGAGIWVVKALVDGKNASSSGYVCHLTGVRMNRMTSEGYFAG